MRLVLVAACLGLALAASGCSSDDDDDSSSSTTSTESTERSTTVEDGTSTTEAEPTTTTETVGEEPASVEDEIVARYKAFWEARFEANSPPNPDDPALREYATGAQLDNVIAETQANLDAGVELRRREDRADIQRVEVASMSGDEAVVQECFVDDGLVVRRSDGEVLHDDIVTYNVRGEMQRLDGEWRLASATVVQQWEGIAGCASAS
jgi:hypothetical protein